MKKQGAAAVKEFLDNIKVESPARRLLPPFSKKEARSQSMNDLVLQEKLRQAKIANDITENDWKLKRLTLVLLFTFLGLETLIVFVVAFLQGFHGTGFRLDEWSLRLLLAATVVQTVSMLTIAIRHLFPQGKK